MDFDPLDPHLLERLKKLPLAFLSKNSGVKPSTIALAIILTIINILIILCLACFVVYRNLMILPEEIPNEMKKANKPIESESFTTDIPADGLYAIQSRATFDCQIFINQSTHGLSIYKKSESFTNGIVFDKKEMDNEYSKNVTCYDSHIVLFVDLSKGERLKVNSNHADSASLSVFKIAEYLTFRK